MPFAGLATGVPHPAKFACLGNWSNRSDPSDLGNTTAADGDGFLFRGRSGIQVTGKANYAAFRDWCRKYINMGAPDFVAMPDAVLTDPWEGLAPVWYWSTHNLNSYADRGENEMICRKINGGTNGLADRLGLYTRVALVLLGFKPTEIRGFQSAATGDGIYAGAVDGIDGPKTRAALHQALVKRSAPPVLDAAPPVAAPFPATPVSTKNAAITAGAVVAAGTAYTWWDWLTGWFQ